MVDPEHISFRHVNGDIMKARYRLTEVVANQECGPFINIPVAASVTAHAQVILMRQMYKIGPENILYCDTDSIMFLRQKGMERLDQKGLGNWENEHPDESVTCFYAMAPKCYDMVLKDKDGNEECHLKSKGVRNTLVNQEKANRHAIHDLVEASFLGKNDENSYIEVENMTIHPNSTSSLIQYGVMLTRESKKKVQVVFSKRELVKNDNPQVTRMDQMAVVRLIPTGYDGPLTNVVGCLS